jgi:hypothetical protein
VKNKRRGSPNNCRELFPGRSKERGSHCENSTKGANVHEKKTNPKWRAALTVSVSNKFFSFRFQSETYICEKILKIKNAVALGMHTAHWR